MNAVTPSSVISFRDIPTALGLIRNGPDFISARSHGSVYCSLLIVGRVARDKIVPASGSKKLVNQRAPTVSTVNVSFYRLARVLVNMSVHVTEIKKKEPHFFVSLPRNHQRSSDEEIHPPSPPRKSLIERTSLRFSISRAGTNLFAVTKTFAGPLEDQAEGDDEGDERGNDGDGERAEDKLRRWRASRKNSFARESSRLLRALRVFPLAFPAALFLQPGTFPGP